ncbi:MAG: undecaprenyl-diphosphatase UppP [Candidatus Falkowbacteria bacterium]
MKHIFMDYINSIIFGVVQGITEFLPISSSGHLVILHEFIKLPIKDELVFDVFLHLATFLAVVWFFRKDVFLLLNSWIKSFSGKKDEYSRLAWLIILASIPAAIAGYFFEDIIESRFRSVETVTFMLVFVGILFILLEKISKKTYNLNKLNWKKSLMIGISQAIALIPGTSRSGITIIAGLGAGLKRREALRFSFLMSAPIILGAALKKLPQISWRELTGNEIGILYIAFFASFISGVLVIKYFLKFAKNNSLNVFAYYRFVLAIIILVILKNFYE